MTTPALVAKTLVLVPTPPMSTPLWLVEAPLMPVLRAPCGEVIRRLTVSGHM